MKTILQEMVFPLSWEKGNSPKGINTQRMHQLAKQSLPISKTVLEERLEEHHRFLREGGAGGTWQSLQVEGLVVAMYNKKTSTSAVQMSLEYACLASGADLAGLAIPFLNACAAYLPNLDATAVALPFSLLTDCYLEKAIFRNAQLQGVDFSRAYLAGADFRDADLSNVDFENCDLREADFRGARIVGARFPGAQLEGVVT